MSYDLYVIGVRSAENPLDAWERLGATQETDAPATPDPAAEERKRARYRHVELNTPEGDAPFQITLEDDHVAATVPHWHDDERAEATYRRLLDALALVSDRTGWIVFDPQLERAIDPRSDLSDVLEMHAVSVGHVRELATGRRGGFLRRLFRRDG